MAALAMALVGMVRPPPVRAAASTLVRVGGYQNAPKISRGPDGAAAGFWPELLAHIAASEGWELEYVWGTWSECLQRLQAGAIDVMPDVARTPERARVFRFASPSTLLSWSRLYARRGGEPVDSIPVLAGTTIAALRGSVNLEGPRGLRSVLRDFEVTCRILEVDDYADAFQAVCDGRADVALTNREFGNLHGRRFGLRKTPILIQPIPIHFAFPPEGTGSDRLLARLSRAIGRLKGDPGSAYYRLREQHLEAGDPGAAALPAWFPGALRGAGMVALYLLLVLMVSRIQVNRRDRQLRQSHQDLLQAERRYREIYDATNDAILVLAPETGEVLDANRPSAELFGVAEAAALVGRPPPFVDEDGPGRERLLGHLAAAAREGPQTFTHATSGAGGAGDPARWVEVALRATEIQTESRVIATARDITARRRTEELERRLVQISKLEAIGNLAAGVAHDFNNLLGVVVGYAESGLDEKDGGAQREALEGILEAAHRAEGLTRQILTFGQEGERSPTLLDPRPLVLEALRMLRRTQPAGVELHQHLPEKTGWIRADPTEVSQILMNLATNSFHALQASGGEVHVSLDEVDLHEAATVGAPGRFLRLEVRDTGPGIPRELQQKVFEPYFTTKERGRGTGLGLSMVHGMARDLGGFVELVSRPATGTAIQVLIPVHEAPGLEAAPEELPAMQTGDAPAASPVGPLRILLIDDEEALVTVGARVLGRLGCAVTAVIGSERGLETFQARPDEFDLVLTDQTMPGHSGLEVARRVRELRPDLPVVVCTGYSTPEFQREAHDAGVLEVLLKPASRKDYARVLGRVRESPALTASGASGSSRR